MTYFVTEIQNATATTYAFDSQAEAESKYYYILSFASKSDVEKHGAILYDNNGTWVMGKVYDRTVSEQ